jgi:hypothetical protein
VYGTTANVSFCPGQRSAVLGAAEGADVGFTYRTGKDGAERVVALVRGLGRRVLAVQADLVVNISAGVTSTALAGIALYSGAKAFLDQVTRVAAVEFAGGLRGHIRLDR